MPTLTFLLLSCILPPTAETDTADYRLFGYYMLPDVEFCYKWHPDEKTREDRWLVEATIKAIAKVRESK